MSEINIQTTLGDFVADQPQLAPVFERVGLDYCCGGQKSLAVAASERGLDLDLVIAEIEAALAAPAPVRWAELSMAEMVDHVEHVHHRYVDAAMPRLVALSDKVDGVHGDRHPELHRVLEIVRLLEADFTPHLRKEERVLFPMIRELAQADSSTSFHCGSLRNPISVMLVEHETVGELLAELRALTGNYTPPADGCVSYRALYGGLAEFEADTHQHVHIENNLLFPAVLRRESELAGVS